MTMQITPLRLVLPVGFQPIQPAGAGDMNLGSAGGTHGPVQVAGLGPGQQVAQGTAAVVRDFASVLERAVAAVQAKQQAADQAAVQVAQGNLNDLHDAVLAQEEASLALDLTVQIRNKVLEAYQEIMRMPV